MRAIGAAAGTLRLIQNFRSTTRPWTRSRRLVAGAAAVLALTGAAAVVWIPARDMLRAQRLIDTAAALPVRVTTARLVSFPHAPATMRGDVSDAAELELAAAAAEVLRDVTSPHLRGQALLLRGATAAAVDELQRAAARGTAEALADLAAALVTEAEELESPEHALDAAIAARRAIASTPDMAAPHFNLALALERVGLTTEARAEFETAARLDLESAWAEESRLRAATIISRPSWSETERRLKATTDPAEQQRLVTADPHAARIHAEGPYLAQWAAARIAQRNDEARAALDLARVIGRVLAGTSRELLLRDAVAAVDRAEQRGPDAALALARAHILYRDGRMARPKRQDGRAFELLTAAADELRRTESPLHYVARYYAAGALYEQGRLDDTVAHLDALAADLQQTAPAYRALAAQLGWERGNTLVIRGRYAEALATFDRSRAIAAELGETSLAAAFDGFAADALEYLRDSHHAWQRRARSLRAYSEANDALRKAVALTSAAQVDLVARNWERASTLLDYAVPLAVRVDDSVVVTHALAQRSIARDELGRAAEARQDRAEAARRVRQIADTGTRRWLESQLDIATGVALRVSTPRAAVAHYTRAIDVLRSTRNTVLLPQLYFERAWAHRRAGDHEREAQDLRAGLAVVAEWEEAVSETIHRAGISLWSDAIRRRLIERELAAGDVAAALAVADRRGGAIETLPPMSIRDALAANAAIVEYVTLADRMIVFVVRRDRVRAVTLPAGTARIAATAERMRRVRDDSFAAAAAALYDLIVRPLHDDLEGVAVVAVVADRELTGLAFGALRDRSHGRYWIEEVAVVHATSASDAIVRSRAAGRPRAQRVLAVAGAAFDRTRYPELDSLASADREAADVAETWAGARLLRGSAATPDAVLREIGNVTIVHVAAHITGAGAEAKLLLAPRGNRDSLSARDIARLQLSHVQAVVLAACKGASAADTQAVLTDIAGGFLAAGVQSVASSPVDVDDLAARATMRRLHSFLRAGEDTAVAHRSTTLAELRTDGGVPLSLRLLVLGGSSLLVR